MGILEIVGNHWESLESTGNYWKSLGITKSIQGNHEKSSEFMGSHWPSNEISGNQGELLEIDGNHWKSSGNACRSKLNGHACSHICARTALILHSLPLSLANTNCLFSLTSVTSVKSALLPPYRHVLNAICANPNSAFLQPIAGHR